MPGQKSPRKLTPSSSPDHQPSPDSAQSPVPRARGTRLPDFLKPLFWEYRFGDLSWEEDRDLVIARVLTSGDWPTVQWLRKELGNEPIREWIVRRKGRGLDPRRLRFWEVILDLSHREVGAWIDEMNRDGWHRRVRR